MMDLKLSKDTVLVGFYTKPTQPHIHQIVAFHRK